MDAKLRARTRGTLHLALTVASGAAGAQASGGLWARYLQALEDSPFITKGLTGGFIKLLATVTAQKMSGRKEIDWGQVKQYCA
jgi:hypothetical protein